jgi:hypothetical protein
MKAQARLSKARKEQIVMAYVLATKGHLPTNLDKLLGDMREIMGDVSEAEVRASIKWALRQKFSARTSIDTPRQGRPH